MENSLSGMRRPVRRRLIRLIRRSRDALVVRRAMAVLSLGRGNSAAEVARETGTARSSVQSWKWLFLEHGEAGLQPQPRGPRPSTVTPTLITRLLALLEDNPPDYGYLRSTWTSELLALLLKRQHGFVIHASTVRRLLNRLDWVWRRARPTLCICDPRKRARMAAINRALQHAARADTAVLYVDEADVDLNPRIRLLFQPAHHPWVNVIERLWKAMHDIITRNHRYTTVDSLMKAVRRLLKVAQPFPDNQHALARA